MLEIHQFWVEMFPMFTDYQFIYVFLDLATVITLITIMFEVPTRLLLGKKGGFFKWN